MNLNAIKILLTVGPYPNLYRGHEYALDVVSGKIVAGKYLRSACERYLVDIQNEDAPFFFDFQAAEKYLRNVQNFHHVEGHWPTQNIV